MVFDIQRLFCPCAGLPLLFLIIRKSFRPKIPVYRDILEKEIVDEIVFRMSRTGNRLMFEIK